MAVTRRLFTMIMSVMLVTGIAGVPAFAHKGHHKKPVAEQQTAAPPATIANGHSAAAPMQDMSDDEPVDRTQMSTMVRLLDWIGRLHPIIVHFPIAFFPAALLTAIVGRRRPAFAAPVQFLVVAGGIIAPIAAVLGWLDAIAADPDPLLTVHRWLGTAIGIGALGLGIWAWRKPGLDRSSGMIAVPSQRCTVSSGSGSAAMASSQPRTCLLYTSDAADEL